MYRRRYHVKTGRYARPRGIRLPRARSFEPSLPTTSGVLVRSHYERRCADFLHEQGVEFHYEPLMLVGGRKYRPDFFLPAYNLFLEICGYGHQPYYRDRVRRRLREFQRHGLRAAFIVYDGRGSLEERIRKLLALHGVKFDGNSAVPS